MNISAYTRYLRTSLRQQPHLLSGIDFTQITKREAADQLIDRLVADEDLYRDITVRLMLEVANTTTFPELERHEDSRHLLEQARAVVVHLKEFTTQHEGLIVERERLDAERAAYAQQAEVQRRFSDELYELKSMFLRLSNSKETPQQRGRDFEAFLNQLFAMFDLEPRLAYSLPREQIDGAFSFDTDDYIIEAKWTTEPVSRGQADEFANKVRRKGKNALGLIVTMGGISAPAIAEYSTATPFMTVDGPDLYCVLDQRARLDDLLRRKKRHANETGECYFPVARLFE